MLPIKEKLLDHCYQFIDLKHEQIRTELNRITESLHSETKSSAGDKHETGRAMLHLEREKIGSQLIHILNAKEILQKVNILQSSKTAQLGSLILTSQHHYFLSISAGTVQLYGETYTTLTCNSPLGKELVGQSAKDLVFFRNQQFTIKKIY